MCENVVSQDLHFYTFQAQVLLAASWMDGSIVKDHRTEWCFCRLFLKLSDCMPRLPGIEVAHLHLLGKACQVGPCHGGSTEVQVLINPRSLLLPECSLFGMLSGEPGACDILCNPLDISRGFYSYFIAVETEGPLAHICSCFQSTSSLCIKRGYSSQILCQEFTYHPHLGFQQLSSLVSTYMCKKAESQK